MKSVITLCAIVTVVASAAVQSQKPFTFQQLRPTQSVYARPTFSSRPLSTARTAFPSQYGSSSSTGQYALDNSGSYNPQFISVKASSEGQYSPDNTGAYNPQSVGVVRSGSYNEGQYNTDDSGAYNVQAAYGSRYASSSDGQYTNDNSGAYYRDDGSGAYIHDNTGYYIHDNSGDYIHIHNPYEHDDEPYIHKGGEYVHPKNYVSIPPAGGYGAPVNLPRGNAAGLYDNRNYKIIRKIEHVGEDLYDYLYETENGIYAEEDGKLGNKGTKEEAIRAKGYFTYTGPDNIIYTVKYTADENGFLPDAAHLPTPPPVPEAIARSLAYQKSIGELK